MDIKIRYANTLQSGKGYVIDLNPSVERECFLSVGKMENKSGTPIWRFFAFLRGYGFSGMDIQSMKTWTYVYRPDKSSELTIDLSKRKFSVVGSISERDISCSNVKKFLFNLAQTMRNL